jgi:hypothetical protein
MKILVHYSMTLKFKNKKMMKIAAVKVRSPAALEKKKVDLINKLNQLLEVRPMMPNKNLMSKKRFKMSNNSFNS